LKRSLILLKPKEDEMTELSAREQKVYSDGKDYSHLEVNSFNYPEHEECVCCGSTEVTITDDADICHECGYVYT